MANDGTVKIGTDLDNSGFESGLKKLGSVASTGLKAMGTALAGATAGVAGLTGAALNAYASYEQLVGGVDKLFGESSDKLQEYAANAYKTSGMSANQYMTQATSFSASLISALAGDTEQAADLANVAMTAMSDNVNVFGSNMGDVQNAFQGFAKQNYTMLDNLKLGYGGTKEEMARLISDASKLTDIQEELGLTVDESSMSFDNIIKAIQVTQANMGILGTTNKEAASTIEGSMAMAKAAWENLLVGVADDTQDFDKLVQNFVDSIGSVASNIMPRIQTILEGVGTLVSELAPIIAKELPSMIQSVLPSMLSAGAQLLVGVANGMIQAMPAIAGALPQIASTLLTSIGEMGPDLMASGGAILSMLYDGIMQGLPMLSEGASSLMTSLGEYLEANLPTLLEKGLDAVVALTDSIRENAGVIVDGALKLAESLAQGLVDSIPTIVQNVPTIVSNIANVINDNAPKVFASAVKIIGTLVSGLIKSIPTIVQNLPQIINAIVNVFLAFNWLNLGKNIITGLGNGIKAMVSGVKNIANQVVNAIKGGLSGLPSRMLTIGKNIVQGLWNGISGMIGWVKSKIGEFAGSIVGGIKDFLGIHSPSTVFAEIGKFSAQGYGVGWEKNIDKVKRDMENSMDFEKTLTFNTVQARMPSIQAAMSAMVPPATYSVATASAAGTDKTVGVLEKILAAIKEGKIIMVDKQVLGKVTSSAQKNNAKAMGV